MRKASARAAAEMAIPSSTTTRRWRMQKRIRTPEPKLWR
jgi:hypothetical protein